MARYTEIIVNPSVLDKIRDDCRRMVKKGALMSSVASLSPIPGTDIAADVSVLITLMQKINQAFGLSPEQITQYSPEEQAILLSFIKNLSTNLVGSTITQSLIIKLLSKMGMQITTKQIAKYVPLLGQSVSAATSYYVIKYLCHKHINACYQVADSYLHNVADKCP